MLGALMLCVLQLVLASTVGAVTTLDTSACSGAGVGLGTVLGGSSTVTTADCTVGFGTDIGQAQLRMYQQDGSGAAMPPVSDYDASHDWVTGSDAFGACLRAVNVAASPTWTVAPDASCDVDIADPWKAVAQQGTDPTGVVATTTGPAASASLRFGLRLQAGASPGAYAAAIVIDVIQPIPAPPGNTALPVVSGTTTVGQTLTVTNGSWTNSPSSFTYQWQRCNAAGAACVDIATAVANSYVLVAADIDGTIRAKVTATNADGSSTATSAATAIIAGIAPTAGTASSSGTTTVGNVLSSSMGGSWTTGTPVGTDTVQWRRCNAAGAACADIPGATASTYTLVAADIDATIRVVFTRTNACTTGCAAVSATSSQTAIIGGIPPTAGTVAVTGTSTAGQTLTATMSGGWTPGTPAATDAWQWRRCNAVGAACADIAGATTATYVLGDADVDATIRVVVTRTNSCSVGCASVTATSTQTTQVQGVAPTAGTASVTGVPGLSDTQTAVEVGGWTAGSPATTPTYQWDRCNSVGASCAAIPGATASTYVPIVADVGNTLRVTITRSNACVTGCGTVSATSPVTAVIQRIAIASEVNTSSSSNTLSLGITAPGGIQAGYVLLATLVVRDGTAQTITPPAGWLLALRTDNSNRVATATYYKVATGAEPPTYTWGWTTPRSAALMGFVLTGVDNTTPIDAAAGATATSTSATAPSVTTLGTERLLFGVFGIRAATSFTPPGGMFEEWDVSASGISAEVATERIAAAGATGSRVATAGISAENAGQLIAIRPA